MKEYTANLIGGQVVSYSTDIGCIPVDSENADYRELMRAVDRGKVTLIVPEEQPDQPSRDDRLLGAVEQAKSVVETPGVFTKQQAALLAAIFEKLGEAIRGA